MTPSEDTGLCSHLRKLDMILSLGLFLGENLRMCTSELANLESGQREVFGGKDGAFLASAFPVLSIKLGRLELVTK